LATQVGNAAYQGTARFRSNPSRVVDGALLVLRIPAGVPVIEVIVTGERLATRGHCLDRVTGVVVPARKMEQDVLRAPLVD